ncbi:N/A [soil metagenome]
MFSRLLTVTAICTVASIRKAARRFLPPAFAMLFCIGLPSQAFGQPLEYAPCPDSGSHALLGRSFCARLPVPLVPTDRKMGSTIELFVRKFPSPGRVRGSLWLVAGGPGESGASLYAFVPELQRLFMGYDIIIPDHRGTGLSTRLCPQEEAVATIGGTALAGEEWATCFQSLAMHADRARAFSIDNAARDLATLLATDRNRRKVIYGVSYGTQLVTRLMGQHHFAASGVILDSLVPTSDDQRFDLSRRSDLVDSVGREILARCDAEAACRVRLGQPSAPLYASLIAHAALDPKIVAWLPGQDLKIFIGEMLDFPGLRIQIPELIHELEEGNPSRGISMLAEQGRITAQFGSLPQSPPSAPLVSIISRSENDLRPGLTAEQLAKEDEGHLFRSPLPGYLIHPGVPEYSPPNARQSAHRHRFPILVLQGDLDPKTAYVGALNHVERLRRSGPVTMIRIVNAPHFILWTAPRCFAEAATAFLARIAEPQSCDLDRLR